MKDLIKQILKENNEEERIKNYFLKKWKEQENDGKTPTFSPRDIRRLGLGKYEKLIYNLYWETIGVDKFEAMKNYLLNNRFTQKEIVNIPLYIEQGKIEIGFDNINLLKDGFNETELEASFIVYSGTFNYEDETLSFSSGNLPFEDFVSYYEFRDVVSDCVVDFLNDVTRSFDVNVDYIKAYW